jgi:AraC-like DNA-binding protein
MSRLAALPASPSSRLSAAAPLVAAVLQPEERSRVEAAGTGWFALLHQESVPEVIRVVRERPVDAVLVSVHRCGRTQMDAVGHLVRGFPGVPTVALVSRHDPLGAETLLHLGLSGVRQVVDVTYPEGWQRLRRLLGEPASRDAARIQGPLLEQLGDVLPETRLFFEALVRLAPDIPTVRELARHLEVRTSTLISRFQRAGLPSPKSYLAAIRLVHAALLFERPGYTVADVAYRLEYSSPQSFGRHVRALMGITTTELRSRFPFEAALKRFVEVMILPYRDTLQRFRPLGRP